MEWIGLSWLKSPESYQTHKENQETCQEMLGFVNFGQFGPIYAHFLSIWLAPENARPTESLRFMPPESAVTL